MKMRVLWMSLLVAGSAATAKTLSCVDAISETHGKHFVVFTAEIVSNTELKNIAFTAHDYRVLDVPGRSDGEVITSNHSEYKGLVQYDLPKSFVLNLPKNLSAANLEKVFKTENGFAKEYKHENGVLIGSAPDIYPGADGEGGWHMSTRLHCSAK